MGTGSFPGVKSGRVLTLTPHAPLVPWSRKCRAIPLFHLWVVRPVQSLSTCTRMHFNFFYLDAIADSNTIRWTFSEFIKSYIASLPHSKFRTIFTTCAEFQIEPAIGIPTGQHKVAFILAWDRVVQTFPSPVRRTRNGRQNENSRKHNTEKNKINVQQKTTGLVLTDQILIY